MSQAMFNAFFLQENTKVPEVFIPSLKEEWSFINGFYANSKMTYGSGEITRASGAVNRNEYSSLLRSIPENSDFRIEYNKLYSNASIVFIGVHTQKRTSGTKEMIAGWSHGDYGSVKSIINLSETSDVFNDRTSSVVYFIERKNNIITVGFNDYTAPYSINDPGELFLNIIGQKNFMIKNLKITL